MRELIDIFRDLYLRKLAGLNALVDASPDDVLFSAQTPMSDEAVARSLVRAAAVIEQTFNGLTRRLWDDPFEWTLSESLNSKEALLGYLDEVGKVAENGFSFLTNDDDLKKLIPAPSELRPIIAVLVETYAKAESLHRRALSSADNARVAPQNSI